MCRLGARRCSFFCAALNKRVGTRRQRPQFHDLIEAALALEPENAELALQSNEVVRAVSDAETEAAVATSRAVAAARATGSSVSVPLQTKGASAKKNKQKGQGNAQRGGNQK